MKLGYFITHPDVIIDPQVPVPQWPLSPIGQERMKRLLRQPWITTLGAVYSSAEQKAIDGARILAQYLGFRYEVVEALGEIDRSSTGYLPYADLAATADEFFDYPDRSARGWETANDAQHRIVRAVEAIIEKDKDNRRNLAIVSHGAVGTLYLCHLKGCPISKRREQPGKSGGNYYCFDIQTQSLLHDWKPIDG